MRQIGVLADEGQAKTLEDYLLTQDISTRLVETPSGWQIWVYQEDHVVQAREELAAFQVEPDALRYKGLSGHARAIRKEVQREQRKHYDQSFDVRYLWAPRSISRCPISWLLIFLSVGVTFFSSFGQKEWLVDQLLYCNFEVRSIDEFDQVPAGWVETHDRFVRTHLLDDLKRGQVWRLITPIFIHFSILHLAFNMYWLFALGSEVEFRRKSWRFALFVLVAALASNFGQFYFTRWPLFGGMSGVVLALFGYVWMKGFYEPELGMALNWTTVSIMILYLFFSMYARIPFAHAAHLVGLFTGMIIALFPHLVDSLRPRAEE